MLIALLLCVFTAVANIFRKDPITEQGANVGLYIAFLALGVSYSYLGLKFSSYLNKFMGKYNKSEPTILHEGGMTNRTMGHLLL